MSRIARRIIKIPEGVSVSRDDINNYCHLCFFGPMGKSNRLIIPPRIIVKESGNEMTTVAKSVEDIPLAGTYNSLLENLIFGVLHGYQQKMEIRGVGYKVELNDSFLEINIGKSHPILLSVPKKLDVIVSAGKKDLLIKGIDKQEVSSFSAKIREIKKPSAYHDKGIFYSGEKARLKPTKSVSKSK